MAYVTQVDMGYVQVPPGSRDSMGIVRIDILFTRIRSDTFARRPFSEAHLSASFLVSTPGGAFDN